MAIQWWRIAQWLGMTDLSEDDIDWYYHLQKIIKDTSPLVTASPKKSLEKNLCNIAYMPVAATVTAVFTFGLITSGKTGRFPRVEPQDKTFSLYLQSPAQSTIVGIVDSGLVPGEVISL